MVTPSEFKDKFAEVYSIDPYSILPMNNGYEILKQMLTSNDSIPVNEVIEAYNNNDLYSLYQYAKLNIAKKELLGMLISLYGNDPEVNKAYTIK